MVTNGKISEYFFIFFVVSSHSLEKLLLNSKNDISTVQSVANFRTIQVLRLTFDQLSLPYPPPKVYADTKFFKKIIHSKINIILATLRI